MTIILVVLGAAVLLAPLAGAESRPGFPRR